MGQAERRVPGTASVVGRDPADELAPERPNASEAESIGLYLARQRELRGISLEELSAQTRIPRRSLERLESGAFDVEPDGFTRGFVRTVANALGLPPEDTVARMLPEVAPQRGNRLLALPWRAVALVAGAALLAALAFWLWPLVRTPAAPTPAGEEGLVQRRDAVRELAIRVGALPPDAAAPSGEAAPLE